MQSGRVNMSWKRKALYKLSKKVFIYCSLEYVKFRANTVFRFFISRISANGFLDQTSIFFPTDFNENVDCQYNSDVFIFNLAIVENKHEMVTISNQFRMSYDPIRE